MRGGLNRKLCRVGLSCRVLARSSVGVGRGGERFENLLLHTYAPDFWVGFCAALDRGDLWGI